MKMLPIFPHIFLLLPIYGREIVLGSNFQIGDFDTFWDLLNSRSLEGINKWKCLLFSLLVFLIFSYLCVVEIVLYPNLQNGDLDRFKRIEIPWILNRIFRRWSVCVRVSVTSTTRKLATPEVSNLHILHSYNMQMLLEIY